MERRTLIVGAGALALAGIVMGPSLIPTKAVSEARPAAALVPQEGRLVIDLREPFEWKQTGVLSGARLHSWRSAEQLVSAFGPEATEAEEILLVCQSGNRSRRAARALAGYLDREIVDVAGGMGRLRREADVQIVRPTPDMGCASC